jgi:hypothetical protein
MRRALGGKARARMRAPCSIETALALIIFGALAGGCSLQKTVRREFSLGTNGTLIATFDPQRRVRALRQLNPDHSLKLRVDIVYGKRDIQRLLVFDSRGRQVWESVFTSNSVSSSGRGSGVPPRGWEIREESNWSGMPGDVHDTHSWFCGDELLYRVHRTWPDDRSRVYYEASGPSGVILFTNTYTEK